MLPCNCELKKSLQIFLMSSGTQQVYNSFLLKRITVLCCHSLHTCMLTRQRLLNSIYTNFLEFKNKLKLPIRLDCQLGLYITIVCTCDTTNRWGCSYKINYIVLKTLPPFTACNVDNLNYVNISLLYCTFFFIYISNILY